jgi:SAM-dependent methyltransferase
LAHTLIEQREAAFHDAWAAATSLEDVLVTECFEAPTALENRFILTQLGSLRGRKLLDIGAGLGESSVYFALKGARVTTVDISPVMVETVLKLGQRYGVELQGIVSSAESLNVPESSYDIVYVANTIHHLQDRDLFFRQIHRALKPGGRFISFDPLAYNPVINIYRRMASSVRTPDESPLTVADLKIAQKYFEQVQHREFWISTLLLFLKYYLIDRVHPNQDRYWKRILREKSENLRWWMPLRALDQALSRLPLIRWLAWNIVIWGRKS